jgi:hypothetical protein
MRSEHLPPSGIVYILYILIAAKSGLCQRARCVIRVFSAAAATRVAVLFIFSLLTNSDDA